MIPYGRQTISEEDIAAVVEVLRSDFLTQGPAVPRFEAAIADHVGADYAVALNSATSALHVACLALGVGPGDWVWTSPNSFVASANCARYCGASVDFVDIDGATYNMSVAALRDKLVTADRDGLLPKVVIPVHFAGQSCDMSEIAALARHYQFRVIEDASHAIGGTYQGCRIGDCRHSDITIFSFHPVKIITTGEGGVATTNTLNLAYRMASLRSHGITRDQKLMEVKDPAPWHYEQQMLGFNYRMIDMEAALGYSQLQRLEFFVDRRNVIARRYDELLQDLPIDRPILSANRMSSFHLYVIRLHQRDAGRHRAVFETMRKEEIGVSLHYPPVHLQPDYARLGFKRDTYPQAEIHGQLAITLPLYPTMSEGHQDEVVSALNKALSRSVAA